MKRHWLQFIVLAVLSLFPMTARAAEGDENPDARMLGYKDPVRPVAESGAAGAWSFWILMGILAIGVTFKAGKRSHLD